MQNPWSNGVWNQQAVQENQPMVMNYAQMYQNQGFNPATLNPAQLQQFQQWQQQLQAWQVQYGQKYVENINATQQQPQPPIQNNPPLPSDQPPPPPVAETENMDFENQYRNWEEQYEKWKKENECHPDQTQFKQYEAQWENMRKQLNIRREELKKKMAASKEMEKPRVNAEPFKKNQPDFGNQALQSFPPALSSSSAADHRMAEKRASRGKKGRPARGGRGGFSGNRNPETDNQFFNNDQQMEQPRDDFNNDGPRNRGPMRPDGPNFNQRNQNFGNRGQNFNNNGPWNRFDDNRGQNFDEGNRRQRNQNGPPDWIPNNDAPNQFNDCGGNQGSDNQVNDGPRMWNSNQFMDNRGPNKFNDGPSNRGPMPFNDGPGNRGNNFFNNDGPPNRGPNQFNDGPPNRGPNQFNDGPQNRGPNQFNDGPVNRGPNQFNDGPLNRGLNQFNDGPPNRGPNQFNDGPPNRGPNQFNDGPPNRGTNQFNDRRPNDSGNRGPNQFDNRWPNNFNNDGPGNWGHNQFNASNRGPNQFNDGPSNRGPNIPQDGPGQQRRPNFDNENPDAFIGGVKRGWNENEDHGESNGSFKKIPSLLDMPLMLNPKEPTPPISTIDPETNSNELSGFVGNILAKLGVNPISPKLPIDEIATAKVEEKNDIAQDAVVSDSAPEWKAQVFDYSNASKIKPAVTELHFEVKDYGHVGQKPTTFDYGHGGDRTSFDYGHGGDRNMRSFDYGHGGKNQHCEYSRREPKTNTNDGYRPRYHRERSPVRPKRSRSRSPYKSNRRDFHPNRKTFPERERPGPVPEVKDKPNMNDVLIEDLIQEPGRQNRPPNIVLIIRGISGSGKSFLARLIKEKEIELGGAAPRILSLDDYFMVESDEDVKDPETGIKKKVMKYEYDAVMEKAYETALAKAFKKTISDGFFQFIIVDSVNKNLKEIDQMWSFAKQKGFQVYICEMDNDVNSCFKRNIHNRTEKEVEEQAKDWTSVSNQYLRLDVRSLLQSEAIDDVVMEDVDENEAKPERVEKNKPEVDDEDESSVSHFLKSKWDDFQSSGLKLDLLDGIPKKKTQGPTIEEYLSTDDWPPVDSNPTGKKRVRWADVEEQREQNKMRAIGFVVGQTDWNRMMDPTFGESALTKTKYI